MVVDEATLNKYKGVLASFMSFVHNRSAATKYDKNHVFADEVLIIVTPDDVVKYLNLKAFGTMTPAPDANPTKSRHATIAFDKKAISFFMPNREKWSVTRTEGNPTQSREVNNLLKNVKKKEARKQGAKSRTRRAMIDQDFTNLHDFLSRADNDDDGAGRTTRHASYWKRYGTSAIVKFQFHLMARIDDSTQVTLQHIRVHDHFPNALKTRLNWSKNVSDKRDAPWQIVLGSINPVYCVLCSLGLWLELNLKNHPTAINSPYAFCFSADIQIPSGGKKSKTMIQGFLKKLFRMPEFVKEDDEGLSDLLLGSHSIRKFAATFARKCGITKDEKEIRGRWKGAGRVSDVHDDVELPYPDAKVAEKLCGGGACFYVPHPSVDMAMMNTFVLSHVVPNVRKMLPESACLVLGRALMWLICSPVVDEYVPAELKEQVMSDWADVCGTEFDTENEVHRNPIQQLAVTVSGDHGAVFIDVISEELQAEGGGGGGHGTNASVRNHLVGIQSCLLSLRQENLELKTIMQTMKVNLERNFGIVNGNVRRIAIRPARLVAAAATANVGQNQGGVAPQLQNAVGDRAMMPAASLMPTPRSLHDLWQEFHHGVGGRKAARLFSYSERGRSKHKYHRRKVVWDLIAGLVRQGHTAEVGIDRIYAVYGGETSVTNIIDGLKRDKKNGTLSPNLRI